MDDAISPSSSVVDEVAESARSIVTAAQGAGDSSVSSDRDMRGGVAAVRGTAVSGDGELEGRGEDSDGGMAAADGEDVKLLLRLIDGTRDMAGVDRRDEAVDDV